VNRERLVDALLWAAVFIGVAVAIAAGTRVVSWLVEGETLGVWKAALGIVAAAGGGGFALATLRHREGED
jgi:hypothetical protein